MSPDSPPALFLPGWGSTVEVWEPFALPADRLGGEIEAGSHVVAWSLGAMRALTAATKLELGSLTLVGSSGRFIRANGYQHGWPPRVLERMRARLASEQDAVLNEFAELLFAPGETVVTPPRERDPAILEQGLAFLELYSVLEDADAISCPVRLLHGGQDRVCPLAAAETLAASLPHAELTVWPEAGHAPQLSQPERFRRWLRS